MDKFDEQIMTVERNALFNTEHFKGFCPHDKIDFEKRILSSYNWMRRGDAENNAGFKQPIGYALIVNPKTKQIFAYQRSLGPEYSEKRLKGKWSLGVGGHIEKIDAKNINPIRASVLREIKEEVGISGSLKPLGYINLEHGVHSVHFGFLFALETDSVSLSPISQEMKIGRFMDLQQLQSICASPEFVVEEWSQISLEPLKSYFQKV